MIFEYIELKNCIKKQQNQNTTIFFNKGILGKNGKSSSNKPSIIEFLYLMQLWVDLASPEVNLQRWRYVVFAGIVVHDRKEQDLMV